MKSLYILFVNEILLRQAYKFDKVSILLRKFAY